MEMRTLGQTTLRVSPVCLGTMTFGGQTDEADARSMVDMCLERGINFLDTANAYNAGKTEEILARILAGRRDRFVLATKVCNPMGPGPDERGLSWAAILKAIDDSLRRLQTDYVDLYYLHQPDYGVPIEESLAAMDHLVRAGKVRFVGASNYASWQLCQMLWLAEKNGCQPVQVVQPMYNVLARGIEQELLPMCRQFKLAIVPYNPLAGGLLTGKHQSSAPLEGRFTRMPIYKDRYWHPANFDAVQKLTSIASEAGRSLTSLAIGWLLQNVSVTSVILGASRLEHLQENLKALDDRPLPPETLAACDEVWRTLRGVTPQYNR
jgi:aryl-alcohol dehydrogenase-like predicted oxidoreductase